MFAIEEVRDSLLDQLEDDGFACSSQYDEKGLCRIEELDVRDGSRNVAKVLFKEFPGGVSVSLQTTRSRITTAFMDKSEAQLHKKDEDLYVIRQLSKRERDGKYHHGVKTVLCVTGTRDANMNLRKFKEALYSALAQWNA